MSFRPLHWLASDMAREGLIRNRPWIPPACDAAVSIFSDADMAVPATVIAALHPFAIDYIKQAPVLVVALAQNNDLALRKERLKVANHFAILCSQQLRLSALMNACGVAPQLRHLSGQVLRKGHWDILKKLSAISPSALAQSIPVSADQQRLWLQAVETWAKHMARYYHDSKLFLRWAAANFSDMPACIPSDITDIADFAGNEPGVFNEKWTLQQARVACDRWHTELSRRQSAANFPQTYGIGWQQLIDYSPLPLQAAIDEFQFVALQTGEQIFSEGNIMHNCLFTYTTHVMQGRSRLYSIRHDGRSVATLELQRRSGVIPITQTYSIGQFKAPCNADPSVQILSAALSFLDKINSQLAKSVQEAGGNIAADQSCSLAVAREQILDLIAARIQRCN